MDSPVPADSTGLSARVTGVAEGEQHACAITDGVKAVIGWGANRLGQVGQSLATPRGVIQQASTVPFCGSVLRLVASDSL